MLCLSGHFSSIFLDIEVMCMDSCWNALKIVSGYDKEIPQSQTADKPTVQRGRATQQSRDTRKTN